MMKSVTEYLEITAKRFPDKLAYADANASFTFSELRERSCSIGSFLAKKNLFKQPIMVAMERGAKCVPAFLGAAYSGNFYVPLDVEMPGERITKILKILQPSAIITEPAIREKIIDAGAKSGIISLYDDIAFTSIDDVLLQHVSEKQIDIDLLYVLFTSGSTGVPKGVAVTHRGVINYEEMLSETFEFDESTIFGQTVPFTFDSSVLYLYNVLRNGCTSWIIPKICFTFAAKMVDFLNEMKINAIYWVPTSYNIIAKSGIFKKRTPQHLKRCYFVGEIMPNSVLNVWRKAIPDAQYANLFGPTEITGTFLHYIVDREFKDEEPLPIGRPYSNIEVLLIKEDNTAAKTGEIGEMCVRASKNSFGYYNDLERTAAVFTQNPLNTKYPEFIYRTGDLAHYNERGELMFNGRVDFQIKHAGHRIELGEIEIAAGTIAGVDMCACLYDSDNQIIILLYCGIANPKAITESLKTKVQSYMVPGQVTQLDTLPRTPNGKIDRVTLKSGEFYDKKS